MGSFYIKVEEFKSERLLSILQNQVKYDFTKIGVQPHHLPAFITREEFNELYDTVQLRYIQTNELLPLKEQVCQLYPSSDTSNVLKRPQ